MKFYDFSLILENISKIKKRNEIIDVLKDTFFKLDSEELIMFIELSLGRFENFTKKDLNIGINTIFDAINELFLNNIPKNINAEDFGQWVKEVFIFNDKIEPSKFNLIDIYKEIEEFKNLKGKGVRNLRIEKLKKISNNLSYIEAKYFTKIVIGEMRGGIKEGLFKKALSKFYDIDEKDFNEIFLKSGSFKNLIENFRKGEFKIEVLKPIPMMLAEKVENFEEIFSENKKKIAIEYKYDGIRVQIHKKGDSVKIFSRNLNDITEKIPSIVLKIKDNLKDINEIILEGELIGFNDKKELLPFQILMSKIFKEDKDDYCVLDIYLFDILYLEGEDLTNLPYFKRMEFLEKIKDGLNRVKFLITDDIDEVKNFYDEAIKNGFEGIMIKDLNGIYSGGKRGKLWLKLKKVLTVDLVILEAFWGYGRRMNWLSDYMLYCLSKDKSKYLPLGKTFKGLTDKEFQEMTERLLNIKIEDIDGGVRVKPEIVVEVAFEDIQRSNKYESGYALRFARILRIRDDKLPNDIDTIEDIEGIFNKLHNL